jgi:hypothetical protein
MCNSSLFASLYADDKGCYMVKELDCDSSHLQENLDKHVAWFTLHVC